MKETPSCCYYSMLCHLLCCLFEMDLLIYDHLSCYIESPSSPVMLLSLLAPCQCDSKCYPL